MAGLVGRPKIPVGVEDVSIVVVNQIGGDHDRFLRRDAGGEATLEDAGFIPGHGLHRGIRNSGTLLRERELLQDGEHVRQHCWAGEIGEPEAQV